MRLDVDNNEKELHATLLISEKRHHELNKGMLRKVFAYGSNKILISELLSDIASICENINEFAYCLYKIPGILSRIKHMRELPYREESTLADEINRP